MASKRACSKQWGVRVRRSDGATSSVANAMEDRCGSEHRAAREVVKLYEYQNIGLEEYTPRRADEGERDGRPARRELAATG
jgi:hypothetical protein